MCGLGAAEYAGHGFVVTAGGEGSARWTVHATVVEGGGWLGRSRVATSKVGGLLYRLDDVRGSPLESGDTTRGGGCRALIVFIGEE